MILLLLSLLFQVRTVFACQMMASSEPTAHCCCNHVELTEKHQYASESCCELSAKLTLKEPDLDKEFPVVVPAQPALDLPDAASFLLTAGWPEEVFVSTDNISYISTPRFGLSGSRTYLSTHRLRI